MSRTLYRRGRVLDGGPTDRATALAIEDGRVLFTGSEDRAETFADGATRVVDLAGRLVTPAFVDSHVHTVRTGFARIGLDLAGVTSLDGALDALAAHAADRPDAGVLVGQGWDETGWAAGRPPTGEELERAAPGRRSYLTRVDGHSSVVSPALAALVPGLADLDGWTDDGRVERDAHHAVRNALEGLIGPDERLGAARAACDALAAHGVAAFHENAAPHIGPEHEIDLVRQAADEAGLRVTVYWGELMALDSARRLGVTGLAGDLVADGAFGSRTAGLTEAYTDRASTCGHVYVTADQVADHVVACTREGLQAGFHGIGDAALDAITEGLVRAEEVLGTAALAAAGHRLEHVEMPSRRTIEVLSRLGVTASVQPMFDGLWGGPSGMYAARLGERWRATNPFRDLHVAGVRLAFGSDSPVTGLDPWAAIRAAAHHHDETQRLPVAVGLHAHTRGAALAGRDPEPDAGTLVRGARADLAVWDLAAGVDADGLPVLEPGAELPVLHHLVASGRTIHHREEDVA